MEPCSRERTSSCRSCWQLPAHFPQGNLLHSPQVRHRLDQPVQDDKQSEINASLRDKTSVSRVLREQFRVRVTVSLLEVVSLPIDSFQQASSTERQLRTSIKHSNSLRMISRLSKSFMIIRLAKSRHGPRPYLKGRTDAGKSKGKPSQTLPLPASLTEARTLNVTPS
jgi:hypothetical protein